MAYFNWDCEEIEYACEDCVGEYLTKCEKEELENELDDEFSNIEEIFNCVDCEEVKEICCNCDDIGCKKRIACKPNSG